jgi:hypothetical protein
MNSAIRRPLCLALIALCPGFVLAQPGATATAKASDVTDTVNLEHMQVYFQNANPAAGSNAQEKSAGTTAFNDEMSNFQSQNNVNTVVSLQQDMRQMQFDYKTMLDTASQAAKSTDPKEQRHLFDNYLYLSRNFLRDHFDPSYQLWVLRAIAALKLNKPATGIQAGQILSTMPAQQRAEPRIQRILAVLDKQGWLSKDKPAEANPVPAQPAADKPGK